MPIVSSELLHHSLMLEDGASGLFPFPGRLAERSHISYEVWKTDFRSSGEHLRSASVQDRLCLPARSSVFAALTSRSSEYPHPHVNILSDSVISSLMIPHRGHIFVDGKNLSMTMTSGFSISFLFSVPRALFCTCLPKSPLCHPLIFSSWMTMSFLPVTMSWYTRLAFALRLLASFSYSL